MIAKCPTCEKEKAQDAMSRGCGRCGKTPCLDCMAGTENRLCPYCRKELGRD